MQSLFDYDVETTCISGLFGIGFSMLSYCCHKSEAQQKKKYQKMKNKPVFTPSELNDFFKKNPHLIQSQLHDSKFFVSGIVGNPSETIKNLDDSKDLIYRETSKYKKKVSLKFDEIIVQNLDQQQQQQPPPQQQQQQQYYQQQPQQQQQYQQYQQQHQHQQQQQQFYQQQQHPQQQQQQFYQQQHQQPQQQQIPQAKQTILKPRLVKNWRYKGSQKKVAESFYLQNKQNSIWGNTQVKIQNFNHTQKWSVTKNVGFEKKKITTQNQNLLADLLKLSAGSAITIAVKKRQIGIQIGDEIIAYGKAVFDTETQTVVFKSPKHFLKSKDQLLENIEAGIGATYAGFVFFGVLGVSCLFPIGCFIFKKRKQIKDKIKALLRLI